MRFHPILGAAALAIAMTALRSSPDELSGLDDTQAATGGTQSPRTESILIESEGEAIDVEWLSWTAGKVAVVNQARFTSTPARISLSRSASMYVRFRRAGRSPITIATLAIPPERLILPRPSAGGEIVVRRPSARILPTKYSLVRHTVVLPMSADKVGNFSLHGLPAGDYQLRGEYLGGLTSADIDVAVTEGQSAIILPVPETVGGIQLNVSDERCLRTQELRLSEIRTVRGGGTAKVAPTLRLSHSGICNRSLGGMKPGSYAVELLDISLGLSMVEQVDVASQSFTSVDFTRPLPWINGSVTLRSGAFPNVGASIMVRSAQLEAPFRGVAVPVQAAGGFSLWLPDAGTYLINLRVGGMIVLGHQKTVTVREGFNQIDWDIDGTLLRVKVVDWDRTAPLSFELRRGGVTTIGEPTSTEWRLDPVTSTLPFIVPGLAAGSYRIQAWLHDRTKTPPAVSDVVRFDIKETEVLRDVEVALRPFLARVALRDETSAPISGAVVDTRHGPMKETEPGVYTAGEIPVGPASDINVSANGFVPSCRVLPAEGALALVMRPGITRVVEFAGESALPRPLGTILWSESECGTALSQFPWKLVARDLNSKMVSFELRNFPATTRFTWIPAVGYTAVSVDVAADGIIRLVVPSREQR